MASMEDIINLELNKVWQWLSAKHLCLNEKKTKFMIFDKTRTPTQINLKINGVQLERVQNFNFVGLLINEILNWNNHINTVSKNLQSLQAFLAV